MNTIKRAIVLSSDKTSVMNRWRCTKKTIGPFGALCCAILLVTSYVQGTGITPPLYWITYNTAQGRALLKIDSDGNVIRPPTIVVPFSQSRLLYSAGAIANGPGGTIHLWFLGDGGATERHFRLFQAQIDKKTLHRLSLRKTDVSASTQFFLHTSQRKQDNFLAIQQLHKHVPFLMGLDIDPVGELLGSSYFLSNQDLGIESCQSGSNCSGGVSSDGKRAYLINRSTLYDSTLFTQRIGKEKTPVGSPQPIEELIDNPGALSGGIWAADMTNKLPGGVRYLVYLWSPQYVTSYQSNRLYLKIASNAGEKLGQRILLYKYFLIQSGQSIAIDPHGKFVIFTITDLTGQRFNGDNVLVYQALDSTGHRIGRAKVLTRNAYSGIDILQD